MKFGGLATPVRRVAWVLSVLIGSAAALLLAAGVFMLLDRAPALPAVQVAVRAPAGADVPSLAPSPSPAQARQAIDADPSTLERGRLLALAGNCAGCHTARGGAPYAGGRALATAFGTVYGTNLTPDVETGLGRWSSDHFWRALQHGRGFDGRRLVPAFPYTELTRITRTDSDALYAWLRTVAPVRQPNRPQALRWPYGTQPALAVWRVLFFEPGTFVAEPSRSAEWNRGAYLVGGIGHCVACHGGRNALGATADAGFGGGLLPMRNGYAPALNRADEAGVADWPTEDIVALLRDGRSRRGWASGPMADIVQSSTQHLPASDLRAMALFLQSLPPAEPRRRPSAASPDTAAVDAGARLYREHCADCHGSAGEGGVRPDGVPVVPPLAGNRTVTMDPPTNLVRAIALGGFGPSTAAHPRPYGMPPFAHVLSDEQIGTVATWLRNSWGARASAVSAFDVARWRGGSAD